MSTCLTLKEVADVLAVSVTTVRRLIGRGELVANRVGGCLRVQPLAVAEYLAAHTTAAPVATRPARRRDDFDVIAERRRQFGR